MAKSDKAKLDKTLLRQAEAREEARSILLAGYAAMLADDSMQANKAALSTAGFMLDYIGNRRYDEVNREQVENLVLDRMGVVIE